MPVCISIPRAALLNIKALTNSDGNPLLLYPTNLAEAGLLDINFSD
jgi:hypothetical protein